MVNKQDQRSMETTIKKFRPLVHFSNEGQKLPKFDFQSQSLSCSSEVKLYFMYILRLILKFMFSKKATKMDEIFTVDLTVTTYCQIDGEDFFCFCGLLRNRELYVSL